MENVYLAGAVRTPIGRYGGALAKVRTDDLAAVPIRALVARNAKADWSRLVEEIEAFSSLERRRIYHLAYERRYRHHEDRTA